MRVVELFCGAGGMSSGLRNAGFDVIQAYDAWDSAVATYRENVGTHVLQHDLNDILGVGSMIASLQPDMICGGPPCQDYSAAGRRQEGENASMTKAFAMLVVIARPQWFLMENVQQAANSKAWTEAREIVKRAGYGLTEAKLDASYFGVAQSRKRLFVIGRLGERDGFLASALVAAKSEKQKTLRDLFGADCPKSIYFHPRLKGKRAVWTSSEPAPTLRASSLRPIPKSRDVPDGTAVLTEEQMAQIQGFPASWKWLGKTKHDRMQLIANAVPPPLAKAIGNVILQREAGESLPATQGNFTRWLMQRERSYQSARNVKSQLLKARRLLRGRTFKDTGIELGRLDAVAEFRAIAPKIKSDLRAALRLYAEFLDSGAQRTHAAKLDLAA
ncbi:DNA (cytosine-5-)-methyltransferase [Brucella pseudogrignonensis]|uniref:DNA cytosine methyltransferase n=1 Tax=Brucella pseudogrignonensis TaxID=419475 RepID=UPI0028B4C558|nr:DNA (cytosine-5-)-methyltransferase [Brucella pseudogrignonensis]MDT6939822.1 DNA (cytosine-5-)-methyltransferase [Brucella pseudogrignonensis]